jgi:ribosomal protein S18 acetylase RimI-like enzyme
MAQLVRRWTLKDLPVIQDVLWKTWMESYKPFIPETDLRSYFSEHYDLQALTTLFGNPMANGFVAEVDGTIVGFMRTAREPEENRYYMSSLYILPDYQNRGLGGELMKRAGEEAKSFRLDRVWIGVMVQNRQTVEWYEKRGYKIVRTEPFSMGESTVDHYIGYVLLESLQRPPAKKS